MFSKLTYKQKATYLIIATFIFIILVYSLGIKKTIDLHRQCNDLHEQLVSAGDAPQQINILQKKLKEVEYLVGSSSDNEKGNSEDILEKCGQYCTKNNLVIRDFPSSCEFQKQNYQIVTNTVEIEGRYIRLLKLLYELEHDNNVGKISSVSFFLKKDNRTNRLSLLEKIYIQNVTKIKK